MLADQAVFKVFRVLLELVVRGPLVLKELQVFRVILVVLKVLKVLMVFRVQ